MVLFLVKSRKRGDRNIKLNEWMLPVLKRYYVNVNAKTGYIQCKLKGSPKSSTIPLQRLVLQIASVLNAGDERVVDHINGIKDDYTLENLQAILQTENVRKQMKHKTHNGKPTSSEYKGVSWNKKTQLWYATIVINKTQLNLGNYSDPKIAAKVYNYFAKKLFGKFALLNKKVRVTKALLALVDFYKLCQRAIKNLIKHNLQHEAEKLMG
jgi:hypothetical protein